MAEGDPLVLPVADEPRVPDSLIDGEMLGVYEAADDAEHDPDVEMEMDRVLLGVTVRDTEGVTLGEVD